MSPKTEERRPGISRRESLRLSGLALGGLAFGGGLGARDASADVACQDLSCYPTKLPTDRYSYFDGKDGLDTLPMYTPLEPNEMRIWFMGTMIPPVRRAQAEMSVFVEVGWIPDKNDKVYGGRAVDQFVFDCGSGVCANYGAAGIGYRRMDKVFLNHLHADHMSDLTHIYCFGPSGDRKSPLYVWGSGPSGVKNPRRPPRYYDDGVKALCTNLREAVRWHTESFGFQGTRYSGYHPPSRKSWGLPVDPVPVGDDNPHDAYALVPIELDWTNYGQKPGDNVAYHNRDTDCRVTHFPVIHTRRGSMGYKLEWNGLSMIYTADTKPEQLSIIQASNGGAGVDAFIHEMIVPAEIWAMKDLGYSQPPKKNEDPTFDAYVADLKKVQNSSHTPQGAFGYLLSQIKPRPRITLATHFPVADDTVACAYESVKRHVPDIKFNKVYDPVHKNIAWSFDCMVVRLFAGEERILQQRAIVNDFGFSPPAQLPDGDAFPPKYHDDNGKGDPYAQIDQTLGIDAGPNTFCEDGY